MALTALRQELAALQAEKRRHPSRRCRTRQRFNSGSPGWAPPGVVRPTRSAPRRCCVRRRRKPPKSRATAAQAERRVTEQSLPRRHRHKRAQRQREHQEALHALRAALEESEQKRAGEQKATQQAREDLLALRSGCNGR